MDGFLSRTSDSTIAQSSLPLGVFPFQINGRICLRKEPSASLQLRIHMYLQLPFTQYAFALCLTTKILIYTYGRLLMKNPIPWAQLIARVKTDHTTWSFST